MTKTKGARVTRNRHHRRTNEAKKGQLGFRRPAFTKEAPTSPALRENSGDYLLWPERPAPQEFALAEPFVKWVGGKRRLVEQFERFFPARFERYIEPFVGGGAVFFHLKKRHPRMSATLSDLNGVLVNTYRVVRDHPEELMLLLDRHGEAYARDPERYFYEVRTAHRARMADGSDPVGCAAEFIFLLRTCFNGLWRVNQSGQFNAPWGKYPKPPMYWRENLWDTHLALQGVRIEKQDFTGPMASLGAGDFAYIDPPYVPVSATANFTSYTESGFGPREQEKLAELFIAAAERGAHLVLSNADHPDVHRLYGRFRIEMVRAARAVNSNGAGRGKVNEVVVVHEGRPR